MSRIRMIAVTGPKAREAHTILWEGEEGSRPDHVEVPRSLGPGYIRWVRIEEERADRPLDERSVLWRGSSWRAHLAGKDDPAYWFYSPDGHHWIPASESDLTEVHHELGRRLLAERREQEKLDDHNDQMEGEAELRRLPEEELGDLVYRVGSLEQRLLLVEGQASHVDHREAADYEATRKTLDLIVGWLKEFRASGFQPNPPAELFGEAGPTQGGGEAHAGQPGRSLGFMGARGGAAEEADGSRPRRQPLYGMAPMVPFRASRPARRAEGGGEIVNNRYRPKLTPEQVQSLLDDYRLPLDEGGLRVEEIALKYGISSSGVQKHTRRHHVSRERSVTRRPIRGERTFLLPVIPIRLVSRPAGH